jgi:preprotein translocase subunit Sec61beta
MSKKEKTYLPLGIGGLIRYGEEEDSKIKIKPEQLVYILVGIGVSLIVLKFLLH